MRGAPRPLDAVVFDLDGVLVDTEPLWEEIEAEVVEDLGFAFDPVIRPLLHGTGPVDAARLLAGHLGDGVTTEQVLTRMSAVSERVFAAGVPVAPGARQLLSQLHGRLPVAVATNSRAPLARSAIEGTGLGRYVDVVATSDDVVAPKPAPDVYLLACGRLGARPRRTVAYDDSRTGIASAVAAGCWTIAVAHLEVPEGAAGAVSGLDDVDVGSLLGA